MLSWLGKRLIACDMAKASAGASAGDPLSQPAVGGDS
jgi:hypothetical protein